jgi:hypothetical protein
MIHPSLAAVVALAWSPASAADFAIVPDPTLTPGAVRTTDPVEICTHSTREFRHWSREADDCILIEYGLPPGPHPEVEIDHLIPLGVGGADDDRNKWPEPRRNIEPQWQASEKTRLEWKLRDLICIGQLDVREAQRAVAEDWMTAYARFVGKPRGAAIPGTELPCAPLVSSLITNRNPHKREGR